MRHSNVYLIEGGEIWTNRGPKPLIPEKRLWIEKRRRSRARRIAMRDIPEHRDPHFTALERLGEIFEVVVVEWLESQGFQFHSHRTLIHEEKLNGTLIERCSYELDAVVANHRGEVKRIVEVRLSVQGFRALGPKMRQISTSLNIARQRWPKAKAMLVFIRVGSMTLPGEPLVRTDPGWLLHGHAFRLDALQAAFHQVPIPRLVIPFNAIWDYALTQGWELNPTLRELANEYAGMRYQRRLAKYRAWISDQDNQFRLDANQNLGFAEAQ